jgi:hypothetical protein
VAKFASGVVDTGGKFATCVVHTGVLNLDLQIYPRILEKIYTTLKLFSGAWGRMIHEKIL